jgi:hypothetical protein
VGRTWAAAAGCRQAPLLGRSRCWRARLCQPGVVRSAELCAGSGVGGKGKRVWRGGGSMEAARSGKAH